MSARGPGRGSFLPLAHVSARSLPPLEVVESYAPRDTPYFAANGMQAAHVEVDPGLGTIRVLDFWVVDDCGRVINPLLVDEQIRGGVVQGIGVGVYEQCIYGETGSWRTAASSIIWCRWRARCRTSTSHMWRRPPGNQARRAWCRRSRVGAGAAIWTAVNDALVPLGATINRQPITPETYSNASNVRQKAVRRCMCDGFWSSRALP